MRFEFKNLPLVAFLALALIGPTVPTQARAQTYQIDCAILLCLLNILRILRLSIRQKPYVLRASNDEPDN